MPFYDDENAREYNKQRDLVLNMNEFTHILNKTDGTMKCAVGPLSNSLTQSEVLVVFNKETKRFDECPDFSKAKQLFISAPEGWYVILKNPTNDNDHPLSGKMNNASPDKIIVGKKINILGPTSFALFPGQMAKVVQGHRLRSNQYLLARVYDADAANENVINESTEEVTSSYTSGQILVIKGTETAFYIPPTGIEVVGVNNSDSQFVRDAVTLERLEYCILKNENGNKRYVHGPAVVFPEPEEQFVKGDDGSYKFKAIELSPISGIYVKVIAEYAENGIKHPVGEELFITGNDQMIYYPRPEHAMITYDGKYMHHAIAIPAGEGRYVMDRTTGKINTVLGPRMFLPDPRKEVIVKRKLTPSQCDYWYPNNAEVKAYNASLTSQDTKGQSFNATNNIAELACAMDNSAKALQQMFSTKITRGNTYTEPRSIIIDNKFTGVVSIDVWTGYSVNVVSKNGDRKVITGPQTVMLDYDQILEVLELSTGKPKTTDNLLKTVFLRTENNKISDIIHVQTKDFVNVAIKVSYCVNFDEEYKDKWFSIENYVKYLCDKERSLIKREAKKYNIEEFYNKVAEIIRDIVIDRETGVGFFEENGMGVYDVEVLSVQLDAEVARLFDQHQSNMVNKSLSLSEAEKSFEINKQLDDYRRKAAEIDHNYKIYCAELAQKRAMQEYEDTRRQQEAINLAKLEEANSKLEQQKIELEREAASREEERKKLEQEIKIMEEKSRIQAEASAKQGEVIKNIMSAISPELVAAMENRSNAELMTSLAQSMSPYAIAGYGESVADVTNKLMRGTSVETMLNKMIKTDSE